MLLYYLFISNSDPGNLFPGFSVIFTIGNLKLFLISFPWKLEITGLNSIIISLVDE